MNNPKMSKIIEGLENHGFVVDLKADSIKLPAKIRKELTSKLQAICKKYHPKIPLQDLFDILWKYRIIAIQEDGTPWSGMLMGNDSHTTFDLAMYDDASGEYRIVENSILALSWYKYDTGKYEINAYMS